MTKAFAFLASALVLGFACASGAAAETTRSRAVTVTGDNGGGFTAQSERTRDAEAGTFSADRDTTFNNGTSRAVSVDGQRTGEGTADVTRSVTGRNGETRVQTGTVQTTRTQDGRTTTGQWQGENGSATTVRDVSRQENGRTVNSATTFGDGTTRSSQAAQVRTGPGQGTVSRTTTARNGETRTRSGTYTATRRRGA